MDAASAAPADKMAPDEVIYKIWAMCQDIVGSSIEFEPDASLADLGIGELGTAVAFLKSWVPSCQIHPLSGESHIFY